MSVNSNSTSNDRVWNSKKFIELSDNLGKAYNPGLNSAESNKKADVWTIEKFINMSRYLSSAYGVDF